MTLEEKFAQAAASEGPARFVHADADSGIDLYVGIDAGRRAIRLHCTRKPPQPPSLAAITAEVQERPSAGWALVVRLERSELAQLFTHLAADLLSAAGGALPAGDQGAAVVNRLHRWQRLLAGSRAGELSDEQLRGLLAELAFLHDAITALGPVPAVAAWRGPLDAPRDFRFPGVEVEVKAVHSDSQRIRFSSLEQLDDGSVPIVLHTRVVELTPADASVGERVPAVIARLRRAVAADGNAEAHFEGKLRAAGYLDLPSYAERFAVISGPRHYSVSESFPRLQRRLLPTAIAEAEYAVLIRELDPFLLADWHIHKDRDV